MEIKTILKHLRAARRGVVLGAVIVVFVVSYVVNRSHRRDATSKARWLQRACRQGLRALEVEVESRGEPVPGAVIVANHLSYLDILVLAALTPVVFVAKKEVRGWPIFGWFAAKAGTRFIDRSRRGDVMRISAEMGPVLEAGLTMVIFLEGTTTKGADVLPFKSSLLEPAVSFGWRVLPAAMNYAVPAGRSVEAEVCWWGEMSLIPHVWNLMSLPWVRARVGWGESSIAEGERKALAEALRAQVKAIKRTHRFERMGDAENAVERLVVR